MKINPALIAKYNQAVPRYTSYPTVPFWQDHIDAGRWLSLFRQQFAIHNTDEGLSLYIHLPFCESMCTYCGCNKRITGDHRVEEEYIEALKKEWHLYVAEMNAPPVIRELHLGGGTPTFFTPANLKKLIEYILSFCSIHPEREFSVEGHPNNTTREHLETLFALGFRRVSYGVQDNDPVVQKVINRIQPVEILEKATAEARAAGFTSVNYDLIYGLPLQTLTGMEKTIQQVIALRPDRIAFYSYAHVPWTSKGQRLFDENDLPDAGLKLELYLTGKELLTEAGYTDIGMDHFALPGDDLYIAWQNGSLHRNFMGYTTQKTAILLGIGVSSISDIGLAFAQNEKNLMDYYALVSKGTLPVRKGYFMTGEDMAFRKYILDISCRGATEFKEEDMVMLEEYTFPDLVTLEKDGLIVLTRDTTMNEREILPQKLSLTETGKSFLRIVCSAFDIHLQRSKAVDRGATFSKAF